MEMKLKRNNENKALGRKNSDTSKFTFRCLPFIVKLDLLAMKFFVSKDLKEKYK